MVAKMGRIERPLSAAPHHARCGQMVSDSPYYIIARRLCRASRPGSSAETGAGDAPFPGTMDGIQPPGDGPRYAFRWGYPGVTNIRTPDISRVISREMRAPGYAIPWILDAHPEHFPGNPPAAQLSSQEIPREISRATAAAAKKVGAGGG